MKEPVDHIARPRLPWRNDAGLTECGHDAAKVKTLTREEYFARLKDMGRQRMAILTCMTCSETARRWKTWEDDPREAMGREIQWETAWRRDDRGCLLRDELQVIAGLIEAHRDEFDAAVALIQDRRAWNDKKKEAKQRPTPPPTRGGL